MVSAKFVLGLQGILAALATELPQDVLDVNDECGGDEVCDLSLRQLRGAAVDRAVVDAEDDEHDVLDIDAEMERYGDSEMIGDLDLSNESSWEGSGRNIRVLYHQTSAAAAANIMRVGFYPGHGICGHAIYFSPTPHDTDRKAVGGRGQMIKAVVDLGRMKYYGGFCDNHMTGARLHAMGYNSITVDRGGFVECKHMAHCREYIIFDPKRVLHLSSYSYHGWKHWYSKNIGGGSMGISDAHPSLDEAADTPSISKGLAAASETHETPAENAANAAVAAADAAAMAADQAKAAAEQAAMQATEAAMQATDATA